MNTHLSFDQKVEKAAEIVAQATGQTKEESNEYVWIRLSELGITKDNKESHLLIDEGFCKEGDARVQFCDNNNFKRRLPVPWFKKMWSIFAVSQDEKTSSVDPTAAIVNALADNRPIAQWKDDKLLDEYGIDCSSDVVDELNKRAKGHAIVIFTKDNETNKEVTRMLLSRVRRNLSIPTDIYKDKGTIHRLWNVGEFPSDVEEESPFAPGAALINGMCTVYNVDLSNVSMEARQFIRVIVNEKKAPSCNNRVGLRGVIAAATAGIEELKDLYPKVWVKFEELKRTDQLPSLKRVNSGKADNSKKDPFGGNERS